MALTPSAVEELRREQKDRVAIITLNRPERLNAISGSMLNELAAKMVEANKDPDIRCIILTGAGRGFCSGLDLVDVNNGVIGSGNGGSNPSTLTVVGNTLFFTANDGTHGIEL